MQYRKKRRVRVCVICLAAFWFIVAVAGVVSAATPSNQDESTHRQLLIERIENGWVVAPDVKFTEVDGELANVLGVYGGWLLDRTLLIGAGGYWLTNGSSDLEMAYGGAVVEWFTRPNRLINFSIRGLVGGGSGTLGIDLGQFRDGTFPFGGWPSFGHRGFPFGGRFPLGYRVSDRFSDEDIELAEPRRIGVVHEGFFIAEPQANVLLNITRWFRVGLGAGYRLIGGASGLEDRLRGPTGSVSLVLGSL